MNKHIRPTLGRGLAALLGENTTIPMAQPVTNQPGQFNETQVNQGTNLIDIRLIKPGRNQPRQHFSESELADLTFSIQSKGILQPLLLRKIDPTSYEIIAGERRWRAANAANIKQVPAVIISCTEQEALEIGLIENLQRHDLNPIEESEAIKRLQEEFKLTQEQIAKNIGKSRSYVANIMRLNNLDSSIKNLIRNNTISAGHARALITAENPEKIVKEILDKKLSVRDTEKLVKSRSPKNLQQKPIKADDLINQDNPFSKPIKFDNDFTNHGHTDEDSLSITQNLSEKLNLPVNLIMHGEAGALRIEFNNMAELDTLLSRLQNI